MSKWQNWEMTATDSLKRIFEKSIEQSGKVRIYTFLHTVSQSGATRYISAYVPIISDGKAELFCIAREKRCSGGGMDMGFNLAYNLFLSAYDIDDKTRQYQDYLEHSWM